MKLDQFSKKKNIILSVLHDIKDISQNINASELARQTDNLIANIQRNYFNVVVVGRFSRGKSTFINALLKKKILPSSNIPTTAVVSEISYSDKPAFILVAKDGSSKVLDEQEFISIKAPKYADETEQDEVQRYIEEQKAIEDIDYLDVKYPLKFCQNDVKIVDTPGTDDLDQERVEITYRYLNHADAVIMMLQASQLLSAGEVEFLKERILAEKIQDIFYVINKKDALNGIDEEKKVIEYAYRNLNEIIPDNGDLKNKIHLVSSLQSLLYHRKLSGEDLSVKQSRKVPNAIEETGFPNFENCLEGYLANDKGRAKLNVYVAKIEAIIEELCNVLNMKMNFEMQNVDILVQTATKLKLELDDVKRRADKIIQHYGSVVEINKTNLLEKCESWSSQTISELQSGIDQYNGSIKAGNIKKYIESELAKRKSVFARDVASFESAILDNEYIHAQHEIKKIWEEFEIKNTNMALVVGSKSVGGMKLDTQVKEQSDSETAVGSFLGGVAIGGLLAGAVFPAIALGTVAASLFGVFDDNQSSVKQKIKTQVIEKIIPMNEKMKNDIVEQYDRKSKQLKSELKNIVDGKLKDMVNAFDEAINKKNEAEIKRDEEVTRYQNYRETLQKYIIQIKG